MCSSHSLLGLNAKIDMSSLTCSPLAGCDGCYRLSQKVLELEQRISTLHRIQEHERDLDIILGKTLAEANSAHLADTVAFQPDHTDQGSPYRPPNVTVTNPQPAPSADENGWLLQGAKPKLPVSSTPAHQWSTVPYRRRSRGEERVSGLNLPLGNKFSVLDTDFPPLSSNCRPADPPLHLSRQEPMSSPGHRVRHNSRPMSPTTRCRKRLPPNLAPSIESDTPFIPGGQRSPPHQPGLATGPRPLFSPTTLIIGDSVVRNIHFFNAITRCIPGATVPDLIEALPSMLESIPVSVRRVVVHVGVNDMKARESMITRSYFCDLFSLLRAHGLDVFISGPIPTVNRGDYMFSRILQLNTWLKWMCSSLEMAFVDNFNLFWRRHSAYRPDGLHPNKFGNTLLKDNLRYAITASDRD